MKKQIKVTILQELRVDTRALHDRVENQYPFNKLLSLDLTRSEYINVLVKMHCWHIALEKWFATMLPADIHTLVGATDYSGFLKDDLMKLEYVESETDSETSLNIDNSYQMIGALYVLLGSSNGAKIISRQLKSVKPSYPVQYYSQCAKESQSWRQFSIWLNEHDKGMSQIQRKSVLEGAKKSFEFLLN